MGSSVFQFQNPRLEIRDLKLNRIIQWLLYVFLNGRLDGRPLLTLSARARDASLRKAGASAVAGFHRSEVL
jgi:hypothetical protein